MHDIHLAAMDARDMLDVLHFLFEEDNVGDPEDVQQKHRNREQIYNWYGLDYPYKVQTRGTRDFGVGAQTLDDVNDEPRLIPVNARDNAFAANPDYVSKPYIPPTLPDMSSDDPFGLGIGPVN